MELLELGLLWPLCGGRVIGRGIAWRGVCRGAFLPRSGEPRRIAFLAHAGKSNRYIGIVLAAKLGTLPITVDSDAERRNQILVWKKPLSSAIGMAASIPICHGTGSTSAWATPGKSVAASPRLRGKKPVRKVAKSRVADRTILKKAPSSAAEMARPIFHAQSFATVVPLVHHKHPSSATGRIAA